MARKYDPSLHLCHRLDKLTSGVLIMAKGLDHYRHISLQFQHRKVQKHYHTLVRGVRNFENYLIDLPLLVSTNKKVIVHKHDGKRAETIVNSVQYFQHYTILDCMPITGRMHQIRVHLAEIECPIIGDSLYGGPDIFLSHIKRKYKHSSRREEQAINSGFLLHAHSILFTHPLKEEEISMEAPYSDNFEVVLKVLSKYDT